MKQFDELPVKIQERMLECQVEQGNEANADMFRKKITSSKSEGGFIWDKSKEGGIAWVEAIIHDNYEPFYTANPDLRPDNFYHYTVSYDGSKHFVITQPKALNSEELNLITATLHAAGHTQVTIEQGVPPTQAIQEEKK